MIVSRFQCSRDKEALFLQNTLSVTFKLAPGHNIDFNFICIIRSTRDTIEVNFADVPNSRHAPAAIWCYSFLTRNQGGRLQNVPQKIIELWRLLQVGPVS